MLKAGVLGAGHLGKIHLKLLQQSDRYELVGFYDADAAYAREVEKEFGYKYFESMDELIAACDMIDVVTPTSYHHETGVKVITAGKHLFVEKPITVTVEQADELITLSRKHNVKGQVGQVERFNPAFKSVRDRIANPMFIETHRLAEFNPAPEQPGDFDMILQNAEGVKKQIYFDNPEIEDNNAILDELETFADAYTEHTIQPIASISKVVLGLTLAKAIEDGHLSLEDDINKFLYFEVRNPLFPQQPILVKHLTSHTSSIIDGDYYDLSYINLETDSASNPKIDQEESVNFQKAIDASSLGDYLKNGLTTTDSTSSSYIYSSYEPGTSRSRY